MALIYILQITLISFFSSYLLSILLIPITFKFGKILKVIDFPDLRKKHNKPLVRLGGVAIAISFICTSLTILFFNIQENLTYFFYLKLILGIALFFLIGLLDDFLSVSPSKRLLLQFFISAILWIQGFRIDTINIGFLTNQFSQVNLPLLISFFITCIWIAGIINGLNWFDGLDGLASGITVIISTSLLIITLFTRQFELSILLSSLIGSTLGFFEFNKYPAKILMGDGGSYLLGASLSILSILVSENILNYLDETIIIEIPLILLGIIILDMTYVIFIRLVKHKSPFYPDRNHLHHRLMGIGFNQQNVVNMIYLLFIFISFGVLIYTIKLIN